MQEINFESDKKNFLNLTKNKVIVIAAIAVGIAVLLVFLSYKYIAPFGKVVSYTFISKLPGVQDATVFPASKDNSLSIPAQIISTPQARFTVNLLTKNITSIHAKLKFKKNAREIRIGFRGNETDSFTYHPLYYSLLQDLNWSQLNENGFTLWQKEKTFSSLGDFVKNVGAGKKTATYFIDVDKLSLFKPSEAPKEVTTVITSQLRGTHTLLIRVDKAPLVLKVTKQDLNGYEGEDKVKIVVSKDGKTVVEKTIPDDGISTASNLKMQPQEGMVTVKDITTGLYQVDLINEGIASDSIITKFEINQKKVVLKNHIFVLGVKPSVLWTNATNINIATLHATGKQTVKLNGNIDLKIEEVDKKYMFDLTALSGNNNVQELFQLEFPKNDLVGNYEGYIAFNKDNYFNPEIIQSIPLTTLESLDGIDYVLSSYQKTKQDGDWMVAEATFDPKDIKITGDKLYFSLEMPDLDKFGGTLEIDSLNIEVKSDGVLSNIGKGNTEAQPAAGKEAGKNIFSRAFDWVGQKAMAVKNAVSGALKNAWEKVSKFFEGLVSMLPNQIPATPTPTPTPTLKPSPTATPSATPTSAASIELLIRVLNGGSEKGAAASVAATLKDNGFTNVTAGNADNSDYTGVTIQYRKDDKSIADKIEALLKKDYGPVTKTQSATSAAEAVVIIGKK